MLDAWSLRVFVTVAETGSLTAAAARLSMTQPAVSRQVAALERRLGVVLFDRGARGVALTEAGRDGLELARRAVQEVEAVARHFDGWREGTGGSVRVGSHASANLRLVPDVIQRFRADHPGVDVSLHALDPRSPTSGVRDGTLDLALLTTWQLFGDLPGARTGAPPSHELTADELGVDLVPVLDEELLVALPAGHRLARRRTVPLAELGADPWIDGAFPDCLGPLPELEAALGGPPDITFVCHDWSGKLGLVEAGCGVTVVPELAALVPRDGVVFRPTRPELPGRTLLAATPRGRLASTATRALLDALVDRAGALTPPSARATRRRPPRRSP